MPVLESFTAAGVPVVLRRPAREDAPAPLILLWHGFGPPASERALAEALPLEEVRAYRAYLGLPLFGDRLPPGGAEELARRQRSDYVLQLFMPMAEDAVGELASVVDALAERLPLRLDGGIGLFGFSGGGGVALMTLAERPVPVGAAVILNAPRNLAAGVNNLERVLGAPYRWTDAARAAARRADPVGRAAEIARGDPPPALLLLQGAEDELFPPGEGKALHDALRPHYDRQNRPERLALQVLEGVGHHVGPSPGRAGPVRITDAASADRATAAWFRRSLDGVAENGT